MRNKAVSLMLLAALLLLAPLVAKAADVDNAEARQEGNQVVITYDLSADQPAPVFIKGSDDNGRTWDLKMDNLSGDVGEKVEPGKGREIRWEFLRDYPIGLNVEQAVFEVAATGSDSDFTDPVTGMEFASVEGGCFDMGSNDGDDDEKPVHEVCVDGFYMGMYEVTQAQWEKITGFNPSRFRGADRPVETVSWNDVQYFIQELNEKTGKTFRLPTDAEWEYAARGGKKSRGYKNAGSNDVGEVAWSRDNSGNQTHPVGHKMPNELGLYDMSGNVWEWVQDWYDGGYYANSPKDNPRGPGSGANRVLRGGSWSYNPKYVRSANRNYNDPGNRGYPLGFRLALSSE